MSDVTSVPQPSEVPQPEPLTGEAWLRHHLASLEEGIVPHERSTDGWAKYTKGQLRGVIQAGREYPDLRAHIDLAVEMLRDWLLAEIKTIERDKRQS